MVFREVVGADYDRLEQQVWVALAHEAKEVALDVFTFARGELRELISTLEILNVIFFGPEFKSEHISFENDRSVLLIRKCPFLLRQQKRPNPRLTYSTVVLPSLSHLSGIESSIPSGLSGRCARGTGTAR